MENKKAIGKLNEKVLQNPEKQTRDLEGGLNLCSKEGFSWLQILLQRFVLPEKLLKGKFLTLEKFNCNIGENVNSCMKTWNKLRKCIIVCIFVYLEKVIGQTERWTGGGRESRKAKQNLRNMETLEKKAIL